MSDAHASLSAAVSARIPINGHQFDLRVFVDPDSGQHHLALVLGAIDAGGEPVLVRVHSECVTGDLFGSQRCDCGAQLHEAMQQIEAHGRGVLIYLRQEGRGIGLLDKLRTYNLQDGQGLDTVAANEALGHAADLRTYRIAADILHALPVGEIVLLTNNPRKLAELREHGVRVVARQPTAWQETEHNRAYLRAKRERLGHLAPLSPDR